MADHDLDSLLRSLPLSSTEEKLLNIPSEELSEGLDMCKRSLIGKFLAPQEVIVQDLKSEIVVACESDFSIINLRKNVYQFIRSLIGKFLAPEAPEEVIVQGLKSEIVVAWESEFKSINLRKNVYQFVFASEDKLNQIMEDGPWCFDGNLLVLRKWRYDWESCKFFFDEAEFWVHIVGLPLEYCIASVGKRLISMFQGCKKAEIREEEVSGKRFFRLRIQVKILEPFRRVVLLSSDDGKSCIRALIQYERLPNLCYACGLCDHTMDICNLSKSESSVSGTQELPFGPWLNANRKSSLLEELNINEVQPEVVEFENKNMNESDFVEGLQPLVEGQAKNAAATAVNQTAESKAFEWKIHQFSQLKVKKLYSVVFVVGGYKWRVSVFPKGNNVEFLSVYLDVPDSASLPDGWSQYAQFSLAVVNQVHSKSTLKKETQHLFNQKDNDWGFTSFMPRSELHDPNKGFLVNDTVLIEVSVDVPKVLDSMKETGCNNKENP